MKHVRAFVDGVEVKVAHYDGKQVWLDKPAPFGSHVTISVIDDPRERKAAAAVAEILNPSKRFTHGQ